MAFCWVLLPVRSYVPPILAAAAIVFLADGLTQLANWRESTNAIRLATGLAIGLTLLPGVCTLLGV
jgi:uncharacterized membrane protein